MIECSSISRNVFVREAFILVCSVLFVLELIDLDGSSIDIKKVAAWRIEAKRFCGSWSQLEVQVIVSLSYNHRKSKMTCCVIGKLIRMVTHNTSVIFLAET